MLEVFGGLGFLFLAVLVGIALRVQRQVKKVEAAKKKQEKRLEEQYQKKRESMNKSIQLLAHGLTEEQMTTTEAAIRISVLMEYLGVSEEAKEEYNAFYQLTEATAHIPILDKWKSLDKKDQYRYEKERLAIEEKYGDFVVDAAKRVIGNSF